MSSQYSDLQVVPNQDINTEKVPVYPSGYGYSTYSDHPEYYAPVINDKPDSPPPEARPRRKCGLSPKLFYILIGIGVLLVIAGAVAGGVLGSAQARKSASDSSNSSNSSNSSSNSSNSSGTSEQGQGQGQGKDSSSAPLSTIPTPTTRTTTSITTETEVGPTQTLYRECPSSNETVYNALGSSSFQFRKYCGTGFTTPGNNVVNKGTSSLNECIDLCAAYNANNKTEIQAGKSRVCNSVCWRHSLYSDYPGQCFGATATNTSIGTFPINDDMIECDSAGWINQVL